MISSGSFIYILLILPLIIGICISIILFVILAKAKKEKGLTLLGYGIGYGILVAISVCALIITFIAPILFLFCYIVIFIPFMYFSFMLNAKIIKETKLRNAFMNCVYKATATLLIWFVAFFPFSLIGIVEITNIPTKISRQQEIARQREEIVNYETYADLTPFGLGIYTLGAKGDKYLWDITKPEDMVINYDGIDMVFEHHFNEKDDELWDNTWGNSNQGKNVLYEVMFYEDTYIIITPLWEQPGTLYYWGYIYLCKDIDKDADLFSIGISDLEIVEKLRELPTETLSREELTAKLDKIF